MKKLGLTTLLLLFLAGMSFAQSSTNQSRQVDKATQALAQQYNLDAEQQAKVRRLQEYKFDNLQELETIKTSQPELYLKKRNVIFKQSRMALRNVLNVQQRTIFDAEQADLKRQKEALLREKRAAGASKVEIQGLLLELEDY